MAAEHLGRSSPSLPEFFALWRPYSQRLSKYRAFAARAYILTEVEDGVNTQRIEQTQ